MSDMFDNDGIFKCGPGGFRVVTDNHRPDDAEDTAGGRRGPSSNPATTQLEKHLLLSKFDCEKDITVLSTSTWLLSDEPCTTRPLQHGPHARRRQVGMRNRGL